MSGRLYLVATPIGNLQDITLRALHVLSQVEVVACEDTRRTARLLERHGVALPRLVSYHEHNEEARARELAQALGEGNKVALVTNAGIPAIADPGFRLVREALARGVVVEVLPGACAAVSALAASGLATHSFTFLGYLPRKPGERRRKLACEAESPHTLVFYESPHRLLATLAECLETLGDRRAAIAREMTKLHEEFRRGNLRELLAHYEALAPRGEFTVVIEGCRKAR